MEPQKIEVDSEKDLEDRITVYENLGYLITERAKQSAVLTKKEEFDVLKALFGPFWAGGGIVYFFRYLKCPPSTTVRIEVKRG